MAQHESRSNCQLSKSLPAKRSVTSPPVRVDLRLLKKISAYLWREVWEAKPLPSWVSYVPNNTVICAGKGTREKAPGCLGLSGGDCDFDSLHASSDPDLVAFLEGTPDGQGWTVSPCNLKH